MAWSQESRHKRGYGAAWDKLRKVILTRDQHLCQECKRSGRIVSGNHVDHINPKSNGGMDEPNNLECLCAPCHGAKTARDSGRRVKVSIGADGWPIG